MKLTITELYDLLDLANYAFENSDSLAGINSAHYRSDEDYDDAVSKLFTIIMNSRD